MDAYRFRHFRLSVTDRITAMAWTALFNRPLNSAGSESLASSRSQGIVPGAPSANVRSNGTTIQRRKDAGDASWLLGGWLAEKIRREYGMNSNEL